MKFLSQGLAILFLLTAALFTTTETISKGRDPIIATVNGKNILRSDLDIVRTRLPEQYRNLPMKDLFQPLLNRLIRSSLLATRAKVQGLDKTKRHKRRLAFAETRLLEEALLEREITKNVTEKAIRLRYKDKIQNFSEKEEIRARHILVKTQQEAIGIIEQINKGADFEKLAAENSIGPSKSRGGDLNYFGRGQMVPQFEEAAFALKKGEFTKKPVLTQFGWHVIKVIDKRSSTPPSFEQIREKIQRDMADEVATRFVNNITEKANIRRFEIDGSAPRLRRIQPVTGR